MAVKMAFVPVLSFVLILLLGSVDSWAACTTYNTYMYATGNKTCVDGTCTVNAVNYIDNFQCSSGTLVAPKNSCSNGSTIRVNYQCRGGSDRPYIASIRYTGCQSWGDYLYYDRVSCTNKCEADSLNCSLSGGIWRPEKCECLDMTDTVYNCINWSTSNIYGEPNIAHIQVCVGGECHRKTTLNGTCQDWGFCPDGVQSCEIDKDSLGRTPCRRSGAETTSSNVCVYQCVNGQSLRCRPTSTQYVAGAIYVGTCPERPPVSCDPARSSSSVASSSNSNSSDSHSSSSGGSGSSSSACIGDACGDNSSSSSPPPPNSSNSSDRDYMPILIAIHDTLVNANDQRRKIVEWGLGPYVENIDDNTFSNFYETKQINNKLTTLQQNGFNIGGGARKSIDTTVKILADIDDFLRSDSLIITAHDTSYNPLLRDIAAALGDIDSTVRNIDTTSRSIDTNTARRDSSFAGYRDSAFAKWWSKYYADSALSTGPVGRALDAVASSLADSTKRGFCASFNECLRGNDPKSCLLMPESRSCMDGGSPFDVEMTIGSEILGTLFDGIFGEDSTPLTSKRADTNYTLPPAADSTKNSIIDAIRGLFSSDSTNAILDKVNRMKDSVERSKDSVSIQPDSLWLDSSQAAQYAQNALITAPTVDECFVCHAELGTLGGLVPDGLVIHVDFANIGGYNICAIIRAVVRIIAFVVCLSLTLGSWAAAFGYNPKNDA